MKTSVFDKLIGLSPYARDILTGQSVDVQPLISAELFGTQRFEEHGRSLALAQTVRSTASWGDSPSFFPRVQDNIAKLRQAYDYIATVSQSGQYVTPAANWLLDNFYLVEAQLQQIQEGVPRRYYADLPKLIDKPLEGMPRVYGIAWAYVAHTDSVLEPAMFMAFLRAYQEVRQLSLGELWALPTSLRVLLLENLRRVADQIAQGKASREAAHAVWDTQSSLTEADLDHLLNSMRQRGLDRSFLTQLWQRTTDQSDQTGQTGDSHAMLVHWVQQHCANGLGLIAESQSAQVSTNLTISNIINSLRLIGQVEWSELIEPISGALQVLQTLPNFALESEGTRQQITHAMEKVARDTQQTELEVARCVVHQAQRGTDKDIAKATAAYHLIGPGRDGLIQALTPTAKVRRNRLSFHVPLAWRLRLYLVALLLGTVGVVALTQRPLHDIADWPWAHWIALALIAWPASEAVAAIIHRVTAELTPVRPMPRLDFSNGIPPQHRVLVVMPCLLTSPTSSTALVDQLHLHWLASREENAQFALLSDWADADQASMPADAALLEDAVARITALNGQYPVAIGRAPRFLVIHRGRKWCNTEGKWIGWERKRGKLEALVRLIATTAGNDPPPAVNAQRLTRQRNSEFYFANGMRLAIGIQYIVTLDSDTGLPPGALQELVAIAAHPLNTPQIDTTGRRVTAGYSILQPRIVTPLPQASERSLFHTLFAGQCGIDPYSSGTSDVYQDLFGVGSFTGKGLLNVKALHAVLDQRFADESVLSHDLLEGSIGRCAYVSDVVFMEDHPHHAGVDDSRQHRWTRGDWQLLPLMWRASRYGIDGLGLWKMLDNLRRSLVVPASLLLLIWIIFTAAMPLATAVSMVVAAFLIGPLMGAVTGLIPSRRGIVLKHFFHVGTTMLWRALGAAAWQFTQLFHKAALLLDAMVRAVWRMGFSRKHLLQWTTAAQAQAAAKYTLAAFVRQHALTSLASLAVGLVALLYGTDAEYGFEYGAALFVVWALSPVFAWWASLPARLASAQRLSADDRTYLTGIALDTWRFFEHCITPQDNHLPPDNLQVDGEPTIAHRTSPTNIGLYLLATACARQFGWITTANLVARLQATLNTVDKLPKHNGHLYNWYQTESLDVLQPAYVSTVDSGNLAGHLLATSGACSGLADKSDTTPAEKKQLQSLAAICQRLCMAMDFSGLYSAKRHLFHIGLRVQDHVLDASYYDLLASESRLASFIAIAKGDVPRRHWTALGRVFLSSGVTPGLKSWSGSMFEYLMPSLVMQESELGLLYSSSLAAVQEQQLFGAAQALPWGVSESAYFAQDHSLAYQYSPFGVPRLALRRTPAGDRVVAPYATIMATLLSPKPAIANLRRMEFLGSRGTYGFMDAIDFTAARQPHTEKYSVVKNYMAHHQGMALVALCNLLCRRAPQRWFAQLPVVAAYDALLHERCPRQIISSANPRSAAAQENGATSSASQSRTVYPFSTPWQPTHLLSNGRYSVALRPNGAGVSRWQQGGMRINISRWRDDLLRDVYGSFIYLRDSGDGNAYSVTARPAPHPEWRYSCCLMADRVQFEAISPQLHITTTVLVSPEDDTELRTVTITNLSDVDLSCDVVSCFEVVLADARADEAHPAFSNLFIDTTWYAPWRALMLTRRPRLQGDPQVLAAHFLAQADAEILSLDCITDRRAFLGRNRPRAQPVVMPPPQSASSQVDEATPANGLDPVACLCVKVRIPAGGMAKLSFATAAASDAAELAARIDKYLQPMHLERAARMASTLAQVRLRDLGIDAEENAALQDLTTALMYSSPRPRGTSKTIGAMVDQRLLWRLGISGDKPIVLVRIHSSEGLGLVQSLLRAQPWWSFGGLATDVVVLNSEANSYLSPLQHDITAQRDRLAEKTQLNFPHTDASGFYLLKQHEVSDLEKAVLFAMARVVVVADGRPIETQVAGLKGFWTARERQSVVLPLSPVDIPFLGSISTPLGNFDQATGEYQFDVSPTRQTPRPWINVIANADFGFQVSETGSGYTWAVNSRQHQITPWSNDPIEDPGHEHYLLQDIETAQFLHLIPGTQRASQQGTPAVHRVRHGQGYSVFESSHGLLETKTTFFADRDAAVKLVHVEIRNNSYRTRQLRALAMAEWQMGSTYSDRCTLQTWRSPDINAVMAQQRQSRAGLGGSTAFLALAGVQGVFQWSCDRSEFFDAAGQLNWPNTLGQSHGDTLDPCAAIASSFKVMPGVVTSFTFVLGHAADAAQAELLARTWAARDIVQALKNTKAFWGDLLGQVQVKTPDPLFDALINRWLLYQTLTCRLWSKAGFYQAGGAFGFRDQLQDSLAFAVADPARLRDQIVLNASRQFGEGDVQHWWHAPGGEGVRTHFSDDLLWLPYACAHYLATTGDTGLLDEAVNFLEGPAIAAGSEDAYYAPEMSATTASIYEHCARAIDRSLATGSHGLPLMGTGDWNDGMNRVGHEGKGESVWLAWFLCCVTQSFAPIAKARGDSQRANTWLAARAGWIQALHTHGWDGQWFKRAFFDNGAALGASVNDECRIDLIVQAWSVLSGASTDAFTHSAMQSMTQQLIDGTTGLVHLLAPPFDKSPNNPGYIQAYPAGVRENGGQYNHAAVWALMAQALTGDNDAAWESFKAISPAHRTQHAQHGPLYELEPYVTAGDIYGAAPYAGRGGWSWYTGSAAWLYRAGLETLLGLKVQQGELSLTPRVPSHWPSFEVDLKLASPHPCHVTIRWQRHANGDAGVASHLQTNFKADRTLLPGELVRLADLPKQAKLLVTAK